MIEVELFSSRLFAFPPIEDFTQMNILSLKHFSMHNLLILMLNFIKQCINFFYKFHIFGART